MIQTRICSYYKPCCSHIKRTSTSFLDLPEELRDRIYHDAGIISGSSLRLCSKLVLQRIKEQWHPFLSQYYPDLLYTRGRDGEPFACAALADYDRGQRAVFFLHLSLSNSRISTDVARYIYSNNEILLCCEDYTDLGILLHPQFSWLDTIRRLTIHLSPVDIDKSRTSSCHHRDGRDGMLLKSTSSTFSMLMRTWHEIIKRLALSNSRIASRLDLRILCDVDNVATAEQVVQPLTHYRLPTSTLRLGHSLDQSLKSFARETVLTTNGIQDQRFPFLRLPIEIRQHILRFTDLVTPVRQIYWSGGRDFGRFRSATEWDRGLWHRLHEFCALYFPVYPHCGAWQPPASLFTVSKEMLEDVRAVFFSSNRFITHLDFRRSGRAMRGGSADRSDFLKRVIPTTALSHLRDLEIIFPKTRYDFSGMDQDAYRLWVDSIEHFAPRLKKLSLRLYMTHDGRRCADNPYRGEDSTPIEDIDALFKVQEQIVQPLAKITTTHNCFVRAMTPWQAQDAIPGMITAEGMRAHEEILEKLVMGSEYDSLGAGKFDQRQSEWTRKYENSPSSL